MKTTLFVMVLTLGHYLSMAQGAGLLKNLALSKAEIQRVRLDSIRKRVNGNTRAAPLKTSPVELPESTTLSNPIHEIPSISSPITAKASIPIQDRNVIQSYYLDLAYNKTTCILFKSPICSVDLGSKDIIADKATVVDNVLRVKASRIGFNETNFSVMTADGQFYSFVVNYNEYPTLLALDLSVNEEGMVQQKARSIHQKGIVVSFAGVNTSQQEIVQNCAQILKLRRKVKRVGVNKYHMQAKLRGLYYKDNILYYKIGIKNRSNLNYDLDYLRFFIVDKTIAKETSHQELEVSPLFVYNQPLAQISGKQTIEKVYAFQKFTIPDDKVLLVILGEKNGGRTISFTITNKNILDAGTL